MGYAADDAYNQAEQEYFEFEAHEHGLCQGPGDEDGCYYCKYPEEAEEVRKLVKKYGTGF